MCQVKLICLTLVIIVGSSSGCGNSHRSLDCLSAADRADFDESQQLTTLIRGLYLSGEYQHALEIANGVMETQQSILGEAHPELANVVNSISECHRMLGNYELAHSFNKQAVKLARQIDDQESLLFLIKTNTGTILYSEGHYDRAESIWKKLLSQAQRKFPPEHRVLSNLKARLSSIPRL